MPATLEQIGKALKNAAAAGDTAAANKLASAYKAMQSQPVVPEVEQQVQEQPGDNLVSQGLSGFNEGVGNILGFPVDAATMAINAGMSGINALTGAQLPQIENPVGGSDFLKSTLLAPTIAADAQTEPGKFTRRIGQELGAMAIPGMGPIARSTMPLKTFGAELAASLGSGTGAAIAEQVVPDGPMAPVAEFAGQMVGGLTPGGVARIAKRPPAAPTIDAQRAAKNAAYKAVDSLGVKYGPQAYDKMLTDLVTEAKGKNISPTRHQAAYSFINDMIARRNGKPMTLTELDQLRQEVRRDLITPSYGNQDKAADAFFGDMILDHIDDMIDTSAAGNATMKVARTAHSRLRKSELIEEALVKAKRRTESTGSGGNINNAIRQNIRAILDNPKKSRSFSKSELASMESLVKQGKVENLLRLLGKLSPSGNGLMAALGIGGAMVNPAIGGVALAGAAAKALADRGTLNKAIRLQNEVATGGKLPKQPISREALDRQRALLLAQGANQRQRVEITIPVGAR